MEKNNPLVSLIMPVYNAGDYLIKAVDSVRSQTETDWELWLLDDGSTDKSVLLCDEYARKDPRIKVVHKQNEGICKTRNLGLSLAQGTYVGFLDHDDEITPAFLQDNLSLLLSTGASFVKFGKIERLWQETKKVEKNTHRGEDGPVATLSVRTGVCLLKEKKTRWENGVYSRQQIRERLLSFRQQGMMTFVWDTLFDRAFLEKNHLIFDETFTNGNEDIDFCERAALVCDKLAVNAGHYYIHHTRLGFSTGSKFHKKALKLYLVLLRKENARFEMLKREGSVDYTTSSDYIRLVSRQIVGNLVEKLNYSPYSLRQKREGLKRLGKSTVFDAYRAYRGSVALLKADKKAFCYWFLFRKRAYALLLLFDAAQRKLVYTVRRGKAKKE